MTDRDSGAAPASPPRPRLTASPAVIRKLNGCVSACPFTTGVACADMAPVADVPRKALPMLPEGCRRICLACVPKMEAALKAVEEAAVTERQRRAQARREAKEAKRAARAAAKAQQADLAAVVEDIAEMQSRAAELRALAEGRRKARAEERRQALLELRRCEAAVRQAQRAVEEAGAVLAALAPEGARGVEVEVEVDGAAQRLLDAVRAASVAWEEATPSFRRKHLDGALLKRAVDLAEWLEAEGADPA